MTTDDFKRIRMNISLLYEQRDTYTDRLYELRDYENLTIKRTSPDKGKHVYYYLKEKSGLYKYLGNDANPIVKSIKEVRYIKEYVKRIDINIEILKKVLDDYRSLDNNSVNSELCLTYRGAHINESKDNKEKIAAWKKDMLRIKSSYPIKNPEQLRHRYVDGSMMRSKSEMNVALCLDNYNIPYAYEVPIVIDCSVIYPDFRLLSPIDYQTDYILEHFGRLDLEDYQESVGWKISKYMKAGYIPGINFFMTFDDIKGNADLRPLLEIILKISKT